MKEVQLQPTSQKYKRLVQLYANKMDNLEKIDKS